MELAGIQTSHRLAVLGGPDRKTIDRLLEGRGTKRDDVLHKLVQGLNEANRQARRTVSFTIRDIPRD